MVWLVEVTGTLRELLKMQRGRPGTQDSDSRSRMVPRNPSSNQLS